MAVVAQIEQSQTIQVSVNGPDDVTTMFITAGLLLAPFDMQQPAGEGQATVTFSVLLPQPVLTAGQFRRSIASASIAGLSAYAAAGNTAFVGNTFNATIQSVDADYDDESNQIELRIDIFFGAHMGEVRVTKLAFQVITLLAT